MKWYLSLGLTVLVMVTTIFVRVPILGGGYFNFGDVVIVFAALLGGYKTGMIAGGIGSALADLIGFPIFAPVTLFAKGMLGLLAGLAKGKTSFFSVVYPALGGILMVVLYFFGTWLLPTMGYAAAWADLVPNIVQAALGVIGGRLLFGAWKMIEASED